MLKGFERRLGFPFPPCVVGSHLRTEEKIATLQPSHKPCGKVFISKHTIGTGLETGDLDEEGSVRLNGRKDILR